MEKEGGRLLGTHSSMPSWPRDPVVASAHWDFGDKSPAAVTWNPILTSVSGWPQTPSLVCLHPSIPHVWSLSQPSHKSHRPPYSGQPGAPGAPCAGGAPGQHPKSKRCPQSTRCGYPQTWTHTGVAFSHLAIQWMARNWMDLGHFFSSRALKGHGLAGSSAPSRGRAISHRAPARPSRPSRLDPFPFRV
jgi:hypothetical protein